MYTELIFSVGVAIVVVAGALLNVLYAYGRKTSLFLIVFGGIITALVATSLFSQLSIMTDSIAAAGGVLAAFLYTVCVLTYDNTFKNIFTDIKISRDLKNEINNIKRQLQ